MRWDFHVFVTKTKISMYISIFNFKWKHRKSTGGHLIFYYEINNNTTIVCFAFFSLSLFLSRLFIHSLVSLSFTFYFQYRKKKYCFQNVRNKTQKKNWLISIWFHFIVLMISIYWWWTSTTSLAFQIDDNIKWNKKKIEQWRQQQKTQAYKTRPNQNNSTGKHL